LFSQFYFAARKTQSIFKECCGAVTKRGGGGEGVKKPHHFGEDKGPDVPAQRNLKKR
jgi:hypothetical protein